MKKGSNSARIKGSGRMTTGRTRVMPGHNSGHSRPRTGSFVLQSAHIRDMTRIGIDLSDLGIDVPGPRDAAPAAAPRRRGRDLEAGSVLARALYTVWNGQPITIVKSPPGGGKTTMIVDLVAYLTERSDLEVVIATFTRRSAYDIAERLGAEMGLDADGDPQVVLAVSSMEPPVNVAKAVNRDKPTLPVIRTIASCKTKNRPKCDVMIVDEAYQLTFADVAQAADLASQVLLVGDPGQIGPVITSDVSAFRNRVRGPHLSAPVVMETMEQAVVIPLDKTYRLGRETVEVIAPLYEFEFESCRPDRYLSDGSGGRAAEIVPMQIPVSETMDAKDSMLLIAKYAAGLEGVELTEFTDKGWVTRKLTQRDIAVVVAHNSQSQTISAMLNTLRADGITVGTADKMQGGQWAAVVALDPFVGYTSAGAHQLSTGRLCVMASRHTAHLTWVHDGGWEEALNDPEIDQKEAALGRKVRQGLTAE